MVVCVSACLSYLSEGIIQSRKPRHRPMVIPDMAYGAPPGSTHHGQHLSVDIGIAYKYLSECLVSRSCPMAQDQARTANVLA